MPSPHLSPVIDEPRPVPPALGCRQDEPDVVSPCGGQVPLVDKQALRELEEDFDSPSVVRDFARDFAQSWEGRFQRLAGFLHQGDRARAKEAALSVKVASLMVGASRLAQLAVHIEQLIENNELDAAIQHLVRLEGCGSDTRTELLATYSRHKASTEAAELEAQGSGAGTGAIR